MLTITQAMEQLKKFKEIHGVSEIVAKLGLLESSVSRNPHDLVEPLEYQLTQLLKINIEDKVKAEFHTTVFHTFDTLTEFLSVRRKSASRSSSPSFFLSAPQTSDESSKFDAPQCPLM